MAKQNTKQKTTKKAKPENYAKNLNEKYLNFRQEMVKMQLDNLAKRTSRSHEVNKKTRKKVVQESKKTLDKNNPMYKILLNAQKRNEELRKKSYKNNDPEYLDVNNLSVADRVKILKLAKKKNNPLYRQLLLEKSTSGLSELARQRKRELMAKSQTNKPKKEKNKG
ncbi:hypothetical protein [Spiroplasma chrysopicola]|uniref:Uncharacterized protein n=1 Tax=Spiroplasma chrysopicola DF-1 TaxID=1276227 RepID=R4U2R8_9MOLU|nr:hypothetical protein [Spiroplasma chrysopicola]AGM24778.1 hypothetical protein SCHRY_v1c01930 [Spiroplasma chrysopicola DF-1]